MAKINIQRSNEYFNRIRNYRIYVDGKKVGTIENGESKDFEIEEGNHLIEAKIDWCGSPKVSVEIKNNETKTLKVRGFNFAKWLIPSIFFILIFDFTMKIIFDFNYRSYFSYALFLMVVYYFTLGRKKYLSLKLETSFEEKATANSGL